VLLKCCGEELMYKRLNWPSILKDWKESGKSMASYCRLKGINKNAFYWNKRKLFLNRKTEESSGIAPEKVNSPQFIEVIQDITVSGAPSKNIIITMPSGLKLEVPI
jgi:hypothetical protein